MQPHGPLRRHEGMHLRRAPLTAILTAVLVTAVAGVAAAQPAARAASAAQAAPAARPSGAWGRVGPGWVLVQDTTAHPEGGRSGPETLDLISPAGTTYQLA